jgi:lysophospholipase L1-like esterase
VGDYPFGPGILPDQQPAQASNLQGAAGITALYAAIGGRNTARVDIPVIGDSVTVGQGASVFANGFIQQANRAIRNAYPAAGTLANGGGLGFVPILPTSGSLTYTSPFTVTGGSGAGDIGPQRNCLLAEGVTTTATWTAPAGTSSVKIMYFDYSTGVFSYKINSGSATNVIGTSTHGELLTADIAITSGQVLTIAWVSGVVVLDGIVHYAGDESAGITFHEFGHSGWNASASAPSGWQQPETLGSFNWAQVMTTLNPAAFGIALGGNDCQLFTAAQFQANLTSLIALVRAQSGLSNLPCLLLTNYAADFATIVDTGGWPAYVAAIRAVAAADPYTHVIDTNYRFPSWASQFGATPGYLYYNDGSGSIGQVHPSDAGHALIGEIVAACCRIA